MLIEKGNIVKSISGHDKGGFFICLDVKEKFALIVDGKSRKLEKPKKKNLKHLACTSDYVNVLELATNKKIRLVLSHYNGALEQITE